MENMMNIYQMLQDVAQEIRQEFAGAEKEIAELKSANMDLRREVDELREKCGSVPRPNLEIDRQVKPPLC